MSNTYTFRVDEKHGITRQQVADFFRNTRGLVDYMCVYEISSKTGKPHYQGWAATDLAHTTWVRDVKLAFPNHVCCEGSPGQRGDYSAAPMKMPNYQRYLMKGTEWAPPDVVISATQPDILALWQEAQRVEEDKKKTAEQRAELLAEAIVPRGLKHFKDNLFGLEEDKLLTVTAWVGRDLKARDKLVDNYQALKYVTTIWSQSSTESFDYWCQGIVDKLKRKF